MTPCINKAWMYIMKPFGTDDIGFGFQFISQIKKRRAGGLRAVKGVA